MAIQSISIRVSSPAETDLALPDVVPIALTRTYRQADSRSRAFGIGASHPYDMFLGGDTTGLHVHSLHRMVTLEDPAASSI